MKTHATVLQWTIAAAALGVAQFGALSQDEATTRRVTGQEKAQGSQVIINQIDTSAFPKVTIFATVLKDGVPLRGLGTGDFKVREDEVEQEPLTVVPKLTPLSAVVTLDTSGSMKKRLADAKTAAKSFIDALPAADKLQLIGFSREVRLLTQMGGDRAAAKRAVDATVARGDTALFDALHASAAALRDRAGRKAIVLLSDGADDDGTGKQMSKHSLDEALALARDVNVPVFAIGIGDIDEAVLKKAASQTGGMFLLASQPGELQKLYDKIGEQLAGQYHIYYTSNLPGDGSMHRVRLDYDKASATKEYKSPVLVAASAAAVKPAPVAEAAPQPAAAAPIMVFVKRNFGSWENPLHSEFSINGKTVDIFTSDTQKDIGKHLKEGWNTLSITTRPQEPANQGNDLIFRIGPVRKDAKTKQLIMDPVLWEFRNGTDWKFQDGRHTHPMGPDTKEVTLAFPVYYAGLGLEKHEIKAGDYVLSGKPDYNSWNSPVNAMVSVNGTPLNSFMIEQRQIVITSLLKEGRNEVKIVSSRVKNEFAGNDIKVSVGGPAEYIAANKRWEVKPIVALSAMQGWDKDERTGQLFSKATPEADTIERVLPFFLDEAPLGVKGGEAKAAGAVATPVKAAAGPAGGEAAGVPVKSPITVMVKRNYGGWENPLHSEFAVNGKTIDIFSSDTQKDVGKHLRQGWNEISITTRPQIPANSENDLIFRIGPMGKDPKGAGTIMERVLWRFRNGGDWKLDKDKGSFSHPLGPGTKEVTVSHPLFFAGMEHETAAVKAGDYVLVGKPGYDSWNSPVVAMVHVNGTPLNSFTLEQRQVVITPLVKAGANEIKLVSKRVKNVFQDNDITFSVGGPAEWVPAKSGFVLKQIVKFDAMQGWERDKKTGQMVSKDNPESDTIERVIPFTLEK